MNEGSAATVEHLYVQQYYFENSLKKNISKNTLFILELPPMWRDEFYSNKLDRFINITWGTIKNPTKDLTNIRNGYDVSDILKIYDDLTDCFDNFINVDLETKKSNILSENIDIISIVGYTMKFASRVSEFTD